MDRLFTPPGGAAGSSAADGPGASKLAVKVVRKGQTKLQKVMWEVHVLRSLQGAPHVVKLVDVFDVVDSCYMIMERIEGPDLDRWICEQPGGVLAEAPAQKVFCQIIGAVRHAHAAGFVHCDIKPANVRLHQNLEYGSLHAVLLDWGYARRIGVQSEPITQGTPAYAAPEQLTGYNTDGVSARQSLQPSVDVWSLGATLCEMLSGAPPFGGRDFEQLVQNVLSLNFVVSARRCMQSGTSQSDLLDAMLQIQSIDRASIEDVCVHPWVASCGELPERNDTFELQCDACEGPETDSTRGLTKLRKAGGLLEALGEQGRSRVLYAVYALLCIAALLWTQSGESSQQQSFMLAEDGS